MINRKVLRCNTKGSRIDSNLEPDIPIILNSGINMSVSDYINNDKQVIVVVFSSDINQLNQLKTYSGITEISETITTQKLYCYQSDAKTKIIIDACPVAISKGMIIGQVIPTQLGD